MSSIETSRELRANVQRAMNAGVSRRALLQSLGLATVAIPILGACGKGGTVAAGSGGGGNGKKLTFWNFYGDSGKNDPQSKWFVQLVKDWNANNDVKVELRYIPNAEYISGTTLQTAFTAGQGPDIFLVSPGDFLRYANGGALHDLGSAVTPAQIADFSNSVLDTRMVKGKLLGLPMEVEPLALYYSIDAFEKAKLSEGDVPRTWEQLISVGEKLTTKKQFGLVVETTPGYYQNFTWYPFMWQAGGGVVDSSGKAIFNSKANQSALQLWGDLTKHGVTPRKAQGTGAGDLPGNLGVGYAAMQQSGIWSVAQMAEKLPHLRYSVAPLPIPAGGKASTDMGGWAFCANAKGANPTAAAKFVSWAMAGQDAAGIERMRQWNSVVKTNVPPRKSVSAAVKSAGTWEKGPLKIFGEQIAPAGRPEPRFPPQVYQPISDALQAVQLGGIDAATAAGTAQAAMETFLAGYKGGSII